MKLLALLILTSGLLAAETFQVIHKKHACWDGQGTLTIDDNGIRFDAKKKKRSRSWAWLDIQHFDRISPKEVNILTYEDEKRFLGRDRSYRFLLTDGEISGELFSLIEAKLGRPVTDRVVAGAREAAGYALPVKHLHSFGGCEGTLRFTRDAVLYVTEHLKDARRWRLDRDLDSVWSADPYQLELHVYENNRREFSRTRIFKFDLKQPLDPAFYRDLKLRLYKLAAQGFTASQPQASGLKPFTERTTIP